MIKALTPNDDGGVQFVCYADSCSGVPGALHEQTFASVNAIVRQLDPLPKFICFPGDEIIGLTADEMQLRAQWHHWFTHEMGWLDRAKIPLYHTTGNHTVYDSLSESVYREVTSHLPRNGPNDQVGLSYFVRRGNLLMVFVNTLWSGLGGEGRVEATWLEQTLTDHEDADYKLIFGHHPVYPVNGFAGEYQREIAHADGRTFWDILVRHQVFAYFCSHILAFDVQVHQGVLQILTAGAGTAHRMPEGIEYLHCMQCALDQDGLRYQVLDTDGHRREWLQWPLMLPPVASWESVNGSHTMHIDPSSETTLIVWRVSGITADHGTDGEAQTLLCGWESAATIAPLWIGLRGPEQQFSILLSPTPGRSPHLWTGPSLSSGQRFDIEIGIHTGMGPGGLLWRGHDNTGQSQWSSMYGASAWGAERLTWPRNWHVGMGQRGVSDRPFRGSDLKVQRYISPLTLTV
ncbi:MAG: metallophosphoesterase [Chloroflexota bacterium]